MMDRQWLGDIGVAILLALPLVAFSRPQAPVHQTALSTAAAKVAIADRLPGNGRISLLG